jgi:hypothetical protein
LNPDFGPTYLGTVLFAGKGEQIALDEVRLQTEYPFEMNAQGSPPADNCDLSWYPKKTESLVRLQASRLEESRMTQPRRGVVGVIAAFVVVSLSFSAQAGEKKKVMGTNKFGPPISRTVMPPSPGDDPKHELVVLEIHRATTTSPDPDFNGTELIIYQQRDSVAGTGTSMGYFRRLFKNGDTDYGTFENTHKTTVKEDGSWETTWESTWKLSGGTGKFKNAKGSGTSRGKATAEGAAEDWEGEREY